jgi:hypothetical protein
MGRVRQGFSRAWVLVSRGVRRLVRAIAPWVLFAAMTAAMLFDPSRDTLGIASAAFATCLAVAAVSFSYARTIDGEKVRDEIVYLGEQLLTAAISFLFASILKHAANDLPRYIGSYQEAGTPPGTGPGRTGAGVRAPTPPPRPRSPRGRRPGRTATTGRRVRSGRGSGRRRGRAGRPGCASRVPLTVCRPTAEVATGTAERCTGRLTASKRGGRGPTT